ncbi:MAG TPA: RagB/SusD family nutrient uptake outer membrane protein [Niabella sp.]|nr:RagB/SusD family nutrient uptake outer membrane protein [Niabella sp.]
MKSIHILYKFIFTVTVISVISGCRKELEYVPESYLSPEQVYADEAGSIAGITGIYKQYQTLKKSEHSLLGNIGTDEGKTTQFVPTWGGYWLQLSALSSYDKTQLSPQNDVIYYYWQRLYQAIGNANIAIRYISAGSVAEPAKSQLLGEARFLRAMGYFYLVQYFGDLPMPTDVVDTDKEENGYPRTPAADVYQLITSDLQYASENLPDKSKMQKGRTNKQAAQALLGKVYLTIKDYTKAKAALDPLLNTSETRLMDNFADLFKEENENNIESLFEFQYTTESGHTQNATEILGSWNMGSNQPGGGGHVALPTAYAANIYPLQDAERKNATLRSVYYDGNGNPGLNDWWGDVGKPHIKKYEQIANQPSNTSSRNIYYLRYADVLLMYTEVLNEMGQTTQALPYINQVRRRAKVDDLETVIGGIPTQQQLRDSLVTERMKELMFEGWRWFDLKRWGLLIQRTKMYNTDAASNMEEPKHLLYPIPYTELIGNKRITNQNSGY